MGFRVLLARFKATLCPEPRGSSQDFPPALQMLKHRRSVDGVDYIPSKHVEENMLGAACTYYTDSYTRESIASEVVLYPVHPA